MKKMIFSAAFMVTAFIASAQSMKDINTMIALKQFDKAKPAVETMLNDPKHANSAEVWYAKGEILQNMSRDANATPAQKYQLQKDAFDAFKKVQSLDAKDKLMKDEQYRSYLFLYSGLFDVGVTYFNNKDFEGAMNAFKSALDIQSYIAQKNYTYTDVNLPKFDTSLVLNTAIAAFQAKKEDEGRKHYQMLIDNSANSANLQDTYEYMASYYAEQKNEAALKDVMEKGRRFYPQSPFWNQVEINQVKNGGDKAALFAKYEELIAKSPTDYNLNYNYAVELFNSRFGTDAELAKTITNEKVETAINNAIKLDEGIASSNMYANYKYNVVYNTNDEMTSVKGSTAAATQKRAALKTQLIKETDEAIAATNKVLDYYDKQPELNASQKVHYNNHIGHMVDYYRIKGDAKKSAEWKAKEKP